MPDIDLEELERLAAQATPGPWHSQAFDVYGWEKKRRVFAARTAPIVVGNSDKIIQYLNNADYIVAACNAVPHLVKALKDFINKDVARYFPEQDKRIRELLQKVQELERQRDWLAKKCEDLSNDPEDFFMPYVVPAKQFIEWAEQAAKEAGE